MTQALKPCPFCGGEATLDPSYQVGAYAGCEQCQIWIHGADDWNRRATEGSAEPVAWMPILGTRLAIRMDALNEQQAQANHYQSLVQLAKRGGLGAAEALAVVERRNWRDIKGETEALRMLHEVTTPPADESRALLEEMQPLETVKYWSDAIKKEPYIGGGMIVKLLNEYAQLRDHLARSGK